MRSVLLEQLKDEKNDFLLMVGDVGYRVIEEFQTKFPNKYLNTGVNEQLMASFAAGVAKTKPCFIYSIANFSTLRCLEQIRNDICLHDSPVCIVSVGGGFGYGALGASHHNLEDVACLGSMPNLDVLNPSSKNEVVAAVKYFFKEKKPIYLRLSSLDKDCEILVDENINIFSNKFITKKGNSKLILASGALLSTIKKQILELNLQDQIDLSSVCCLSDRTLNMIDFSSYENVASFDEMVYSGSIASLMHKHLYTNNLRIKYKDFYVTNYSNISGGDANYYREHFDMSIEKIRKFLIYFAAN